MRISIVNFEKELCFHSLCVWVKIYVDTWVFAISGDEMRIGVIQQDEMLKK